MEYDIVLGVWVFTHTLTAQDVADYIGVNKSKPADLVSLGRSLAVSYSLVDDVLRGAPILRGCPDDVYDQIVLEVAVEINKRKNSSAGADQGATFTNAGQPVRGPRDPLASVRPMLRRYAGYGVA